MKNKQKEIIAKSIAFASWSEVNEASQENIKVGGGYDLSGSDCKGIRGTRIVGFGFRGRPHNDMGQNFVSPQDAPHLSCF